MKVKSFKGLVITFSPFCSSYSIFQQSITEVTNILLDEGLNLEFKRWLKI